MLATNLPNSRVSCNTDGDVTNAYALFGQGRGGGGSASGEPHLAFISPPILLCETSQRSEFHWIKTAKRKEIDWTIIGPRDWTSGDGRGHITNRKRKF